jgi:hypothetical protein
MQFPRLKRYFHRVVVDAIMEAMIPAKRLDWPESNVDMRL